MNYVFTGGLGALLAFLLWPSQSAIPTSQPLPVINEASSIPTETSTKALEIPNESMPVEKLVETLSQWVLQDGEAALAWAETHLDADQQNAVLHDVLATWAWHDPEALVTWFRSGYLPDKFRHARVSLRGPHREAIGTLVTQWLALRDPVRAAQFIIDDIYQFKTNISASGTGRALASNLTSSHEHQQVCRALLPFYEWHKHHLGETNHVLVSWEEIDPAAARAFLTQYPAPGPNTHEVAGQLVNASEPLSKPTVADQQLAEAPHEKRAAVMQRIVSTWAKQDPNAASQWLAQQGNAPDTVWAHVALAEHIGEKDPHSGMEHAIGLLEGPRLESTLQSIITDWAKRSLNETLNYLETNPENWPAERRERLYQLALTEPTRPTER